MKKFLARTSNPWFWVPSLYFAEGIPYVIVMTVSVVMYKRLGVSNSDIALYTSWLYLPWVIKPLWSPVVDMFRTKRFWIITMQLILGAGLAGVAFTIPVPHFFQLTLAFFWLLAFSSATHDIAVDGFYMLGLSQRDQAFFVGIRSTFYRFAMLTGQGLVVIMAGYFESSTGLGDVRFAVSSRTEFVQVPNLNPDSFIPEKRAEADLYFNGSTTVIIGTNKLDKATADSILQQTRKWNIQHGFYQPDTVKKDAGATEKNLWEKLISDPLERSLRKAFGEKKSLPSTALAGNMGIAYLKISSNPGPENEVIINTARTSGDKNFSLLEGAHLVFHSGNWDKPACLLFQVDPRFDQESSAVFTGRSGNIPLAWTLCFVILAGLFILFFLYHRLFLPRPVEDAPATGAVSGKYLKEFFAVFADFFRKKDIGIILAFLLLYRFAEAQLVKMSVPFLLDNRDVGGLGLSTGDIGFVYGTAGVIALTIGGIIGGIVASRKGLKYWIWWMISAMNLPIISHIYLSFVQPESLFVIGWFVALEQFGYGFGFTAYMLYMIYISQGNHKTAHFAITTGFMALGMMLPGMFSGWLQEIIGYKHFFVWVVLCTIPGFIVTGFLKVDPSFGKKEAE